MKRGQDIVLSKIKRCRVLQAATMRPHGYQLIVSPRFGQHRFVENFSGDSKPS
jgi:hypothetical protein